MKCIYIQIYKEDIEKVNCTLKSLGYKRINRKIAHKLVPNIETELLYNGNVKIFNCLFTDIVCYKVKYETEAKNRWKEIEVKKMNKSQLAYFAHDITINRSTESNFIEVNVSLAPLFARIS